jgi:hypothetical protein
MAEGGVVCEPFSGPPTGRDRQSLDDAEILFVRCWPLVLLTLFFYPFVWLILVPFRLVGVAVEGFLAFDLDTIRIAAAPLARTRT